MKSYDERLMITDSITDQHNDNQYDDIIPPYQ